MPEISRFLDITIVMFYDDQNRPHFRAKHSGKEVLVAITTGEVLAGQLSLQAMGLIQKWREQHKAELIADWLLARERKPLRRIEPLE